MKTLRLRQKGYKLSNKKWIELDTYEVATQMWPQYGLNISEYLHLSDSKARRNSKKAVKVLKNYDRIVIRQYGS